MEYPTPDDSTTSGSLMLPPGLSFDCCVVAISEGVAPSDRNCIDPLMTPSTGMCSLHTYTGDKGRTANLTKAQYFPLSSVVGLLNLPA